MPDDRVSDFGTPSAASGEEAAAAGSIDDRHLLVVGAGPGLGMAVARRFAEGGYRVTLVARSKDALDELADSLADTGAQIDRFSADASDPDGLGARISALYRGHRAPGLIVYNAVMGAPDQLLSSSVAHLQAAYAVDVIGAIVVAQGRRSSHASRRLWHHHCHWRRVCRSSHPGSRDRLPRQGGPPVGRDDARSRFGGGWHPRGDAHDRRPDSCRQLL
jgi:NAD(P)-dependent dehydrogenase (short-subunit alcohol dehydrogenase family)